MPARSINIERNNPRRSPYKDKEGFCGVCGTQAFRFNLIEQRGTMVDRTHIGCYDDPNTFNLGALRRPRAYGNTPD